MNRIAKFALAALALALFVSGCDRTAPAGQSETSANPTDDGRKPAPTFTLTDHNANTHTLSDYRDKIVVLEWVNPECPFVVRHYEADTMVNLANAYADRGVVWLAVNSTSHFNQAKNKAFAEKYQVPYAVLDDSSGTVGRSYDARTTPHMIVIDKAGRIAYDGAIDDDPQGRKTDKTNYVKAAVEELLAAKAVTTPETKPYGCTVKYAQ